MIMILKRMPQEYHKSSPELSSTYNMSHSLYNVLVVFMFRFIPMHIMKQSQTLEYKCYAIV